MSRVSLILDPAGLPIRKTLPAGSYEIWADVFDPGAFWMPEETATLLKERGSTVPVHLTLSPDMIPIFYTRPIVGPDTLPDETSVRVRTLAGHGVAVIWVGCSVEGDLPESSTMQDPYFYLRKRGANATHMWRLLRSRDDARTYAEEHLLLSPLRATLADELPADDFAALLARAVTGA